MPSFLAKYRTKTRRPVSFRARGSNVKFKARRVSQRRRRVSF